MTKIHFLPLKFVIVFILALLTWFSIWPLTFILTLHFSISWKWKFWNVKGQSRELDESSRPKWKFGNLTNMKMNQTWWMEILKFEGPIWKQPKTPKFVLLQLLFCFHIRMFSATKLRASWINVYHIMSWEALQVMGFMQEQQGGCN